MNSQQGLTGRDRDIAEFIRQEKDKPGFKEMFKKIMEGDSSTKKVENFLSTQEMMAMHDYQKAPMLYKTAKEIFETPGYDPASKAEAKRQLDLMDAGLPRFPEA